MAVMSSFPQDSLLFEHKAQPVPSEMALDIEINGVSKHDDTTRDTSMHDLAMIDDSTVMDSASTPALTESATKSPLLATPAPHDLSSASDTSQENSDATPKPDKIPAADATTPPPSTNNVIAPANDATNASFTSPPPPLTSTLPIVESQESDLRAEIFPATMEQTEETRAEKHNLDLVADSDLASGLDTTITQPSVTATDPTGAAANTSELISHSDAQADPSASMSSLGQTTTSQSDSVAPPTHLEPAPQDATMTDAPASPAKVSRERDEDMEDVPSAKRTKVEDDEDAIPQFPKSEASQTNGEHQNGVSTPAGEGSVSAAATPGRSTPGAAEPVDDSQKPTPHQVKELQKAIRAQKSTKGGRNFKDSVGVLWPDLAELYASKVTDPIDLLMIDHKLRDGAYATLADFKADVNKIYVNSVLFNGEVHVVTAAAVVVRDTILSKIPPPEPPRPIKSTVKRATPKPDAPRVRRQSRGAAAAVAPNNGGASQAFALDPSSGVPIIRRDSTKLGDGGRPKREIHPPKNKDLIYSKRPKKRKFAAEIKFCDHVLGEIRKPRYLSITAPFNLPVDPVSLGIPQYFSIIRNPMDISTIATKLGTGQYERAKEFEDDWRLMFKNCYKFNPEGNPINLLAHQLEDAFDAEWSKKADYLAVHGEPAQVASPVEYESEEDEESDEGETVEEDTSGAVHAVAKNRLIEEQCKLIDLMGVKKPDQTAIQMQQAIVNFCKTQVEAEQAKIKASKPVAKEKPGKRDGGKQKGGRPGKKPGRAKKPDPPGKIGVAEKEVISNGIGSLNESEMQMAIKLLKVDFPNLNVEDEVEFDIDQFSTTTLLALYGLITRTHPELIPAKAPKAVRRTSQPAQPRKKNKPMSKTEQESKIEHLKKLTDELNRSGSVSDHSNPTVRPSIEKGESSGDEETSDSEED